MKYVVEMVLGQCEQAVKEHDDKSKELAATQQSQAQSSAVDGTLSLVCVCSPWLKCFCAVYESIDTCL